MQCFTGEKVFIFVAQTVNSQAERIIDEFWDPPRYHPIFVVIDDDDVVIKYRQQKAWFAPGKKTKIEEMVEQLMTLYS